MNLLDVVPVRMAMAWGSRCFLVFFGCVLFAGFAGLCSEVGEAVKSDAVELQVETQGSKVWGLWLTLIGSLVGVVVVVFAGFLGWGYVKKRYVKKALGMKPEVSEG